MNAEEPKPVESTPAATEGKVDSPKETSKPSKRNSIFGSIYQKVRSPTSEKKEHEVAPMVPPKDEPISSEAPQLPETATAEDPIVAPVKTEAPTSTELPAETKGEETATPSAEIAATARETPNTETPMVEAPKPERKGSFFGSLMNKARAKSPANGKREAAISTETAPVVPPKDDEVSAATEPQPEETAGDALPSTSAATEADKPVAGRPTEPRATPKDSRRRSYFGSFAGNKKEKTEGENDEKPFGKIGSIFRRPSQAVRSATNKDSKKENVTPEKVEEAPAESKEPEIDNATKKPEATSTEPEKTEEAIGDVVPAAVNTEQPGQNNPTVSAAA